MIVYCPSCGAKGELDDQYDGCEVQCPECNKIFVATRPIELIVCPACHAKISPQATSCPHCGHPLKEETPLEQNHQDTKIIIQSSPYLTLEKPQNYNILLASCIITAIVGITMIMGGCEESSYTNLIGIGGLFLFTSCICGSLLSTREVTCGRCGNRWKGQPEGGGSCLVAVFLFCLGIIPGLIYLVVCGKRKFKCHQCGLERDV